MTPEQICSAIIKACQDYQSFGGLNLNLRIRDALIALQTKAEEVNPVTAGYDAPRTRGDDLEELRWTYKKISDLIDERDRLQREIDKLHKLLLHEGTAAGVLDGLRQWINKNPTTPT